MRHSHSIYLELINIVASLAFFVGLTVGDGGVWVWVKKESDGGFIEDIDVLVQPLHPLDLDYP